MSILTEYDEEKTRKLWAKEDFEDGVKEGIEKGKKKSLLTFLKNGGTEEQAVSMLEVTSEEVRQATEELQKANFK